MGHPARSYTIISHNTRYPGTFYYIILADAYTPLFTRTTTPPDKRRRQQLWQPRRRRRLRRRVIDRRTFARKNPPTIGWMGLSLLFPPYPFVCVICLTEKVATTMLIFNINIKLLNINTYIKMNVRSLGRQGRRRLVAPRKQSAAPLCWGRSGRTF